MNSIPSPGCTGGICEGANDNFNNYHPTATTM